MKPVYKLIAAFFLVLIVLTACGAAQPVQPADQPSPSAVNVEQPSAPVLQLKSYINYDGTNQHAYGVYEYVRSDGAICVMTVSLNIVKEPSISCP